MTVTPAAAPVRRMAGVGVLLAVALAVLIGWVAVHHGRPLVLDLALHTAVVHHRMPVLTTAAIAVTSTAEPLAYALAALGGLLAVRSRPRWLGALIGVSVLGVGQLLRFGLSIGVGRARPPAADWAAQASGFALPSGHTTTATLAAGLLGVGLARHLRGARRAAGLAVAACWAVAVGATRVYLGMHWPSDVLAGWLLGSLVTVFAAGLFALLRGSGASSTLDGSVPPGGSGALGPQRADEQHKSGQL